MDDMSAYYLLGYYSTNTKTDGKYRKIEVKVKAPGVKVKARRGYVAITPEAAATANAAAAKPPVASGPSPVDAALGSLVRLDKEPSILTYGVASATDLTVVVEIPADHVGRATWAQGADVQAIFSDAAGAALGTVKGRVDPTTPSVRLQTPLGFGAGPWKVLVRVDSREDSFDDRLDIKPPAGSVLGDALISRGTPAAQSALKPVADLEFRRTERVHVEWPVLAGPLDERTGRLLDRRGQPLPLEVALTERSATSGPVLAADVNLGPLAPADYLIEVTAGHGTDTERKLVAIRVIR